MGSLTLFGPLRQLFEAEELALIGEGQAAGEEHGLALFVLGKIEVDIIIAGIGSRCPCGLDEICILFFGENPVQIGGSLQLLFGCFIGEDSRIYPIAVFIADAVANRANTEDIVARRQVFIDEGVHIEIGVCAGAFDVCGCLRGIDGRRS